MLHWRSTSYFSFTYIDIVRAIDIDIDISIKDIYIDINRQR